MPDAEQQARLAVKDEQIKILQDLLKGSIRPADLNLARDVQRHEHALFGVTGRNGMASDIATVKEDVESLDKKFDEMRDKEFKEIRGALESARKDAANARNEARQDAVNARRFLGKVLIAIAPVAIAIIGLLLVILHYG